MEEYCQNPLCENKAIKEVPVSVRTTSDQVRALCSACEEVYIWGMQHGSMLCEGLKIDPPPKEKGDEPLYRVVYIIDVNAGDVHEAAEYTHRIMTDPDSLRPVLHVIDSKGSSTEIDLSKDNANPDDSGETANYEAAAQYLADNGDRIFTGPMKGGLWNGRCLDACIMSKKQGDKAAYEFLIKFGDQYVLSLSNDEKRKWQEIKDHAAGLLKNSKENTKQKNGGSYKD
ncbi:hypothetical protein ACFL5F_09075 [Planctomycetota bacterium]